MSTEIISAVHGLAPRSDELLQLGGDVSRGRATPEEYEARLAREQTEWLDLQIDAGIDLYENGKLRWQDHLRPVVKASTGFAPDIDNAPVTRWFSDNRFYRKPTITRDIPTIDVERFIELTRRGRGPYISLLSPGTFAALCDSKASWAAEVSIGDLYYQLVDGLCIRGLKELLLEDYGISKQHRRSKDTELDFAKGLAKCYPDLNIGLISHGPKVRTNYITRPDGLALDGQPSHYAVSDESPWSLQHLSKGQPNWQQVIDTSTTYLDKIHATDWSPQLIKQLNPGRIVLTHTVDLEHLPLAQAKAKVWQLGKLAAAIRSNYQEAYYQEGGRG